MHAKGDNSNQKVAPKTLFNMRAVVLLYKLEILKGPFHICITIPLAINHSVGKHVPPDGTGWKM